MKAGRKEDRATFLVSAFQFTLTDRTANVNRRAANPVGRIEHADFGFLRYCQAVGGETGGVNNLSDHVVNSPFMVSLDNTLDNKFHVLETGRLMFSETKICLGIFSGISRLAALLYASRLILFLSVRAACA